MKPIVDGLESELEDQLRVVRVNIQSPAGRSIANTYGSNITPTFIFFDSYGIEQWRSFGQIDREQVYHFISGHR